MDGEGVETAHVHGVVHRSVAGGVRVGSLTRGLIAKLVRTVVTAKGEEEIVGAAGTGLLQPEK